MKIKIPYNWLKEYVAIKDNPKELVKRLSLFGPSVDRISDLGEILDKMVVGKIVEIKKHPGADRLQVCQVDTKKKQLQIICGAPNIYGGMLVAVALVGAKVRWHGQGELVELKEAEIRGIKSQGMICAAPEIGMSDFFPGQGMQGVIDLTGWRALKAGVPLAKALDLDDTIFEIEVTSNRPDLFSVIGLAREVAAITKSKIKNQKSKTCPEQGGRIKNPPREGITPRVKNSKFTSLSVEVRAKDLCPRYTAVVMENVKVQPSPWWLQKRLVMAGLRPINNIVDITNYVMLEYGQPLHVFDFIQIENMEIPNPNPQIPNKFKIQNPKLETKQIIVRRAKNKEVIVALDGKKYELNDSMLVIADSQKPIAIAGVMGGEKSAVGSSTKTIILESANFEPTSIRKTGHILSIFSDAQSRFEKGLPEELTLLGINRAIELVRQVASGEAASSIIDVWSQKNKRAGKKIILHSFQVERFLGVKIASKEMIKILSSLGFMVYEEDHHPLVPSSKRRGEHHPLVPSSKRRGEGVVAEEEYFKVEVPWWRQNDVRLEIDLIEEIGRIYGYSRLPSRLSSGEIPQVSSPAIFFWENRLKELLIGCGFVEVYTYSFVPAENLKRANLDFKGCLKILNPLSSDWEYMRPSLVPSLLEVVVNNQGHKENFKIFEISRVYHRNTKYQIPNTKYQKSKIKNQSPEGGKYQDELPEEPYRLTGMMVGKEKDDQLFFEAKGVVELILKKMGINKNQKSKIKNQKSKIKNQKLLEYQKVDPNEQGWWNSQKTASILLEGEEVGKLGVVGDKVLYSFGIKRKVVCFDLDLEALVGKAVLTLSYHPLPQFPEVKRDLAIVLDKRIWYNQIVGAIWGVDDRIKGVELFDRYEAKEWGPGKQGLAFHLIFRSDQKTLNDREADQVFERIVKTLKDKLGAEVRKK